MMAQPQVNSLQYFIIHENQKSKEFTIWNKKFQLLIHENVNLKIPWIRNINISVISKKKFKWYTTCIMLLKKIKYNFIKIIYHSFIFLNNSIWIFFVWYKGTSAITTLPPIRTASQITTDQTAKEIEEPRKKKSKNDETTAGEFFAI